METQVWDFISNQSLAPAMLIQTRTLLHIVYWHCRLYRVLWARGMRWLISRCKIRLGCLFELRMRNNNTFHWNSSFTVEFSRRFFNSNIVVFSTFGGGTFTVLPLKQDCRILGGKTWPLWIYWNCYYWRYSAAGPPSSSSSSGQSAGNATSCGVPAISPVLDLTQTHRIRGKIFIA